MSEERTVHVTRRRRKCIRCGRQHKRGDMHFVDKHGNTVCLGCAGLEKLVFLPAGDCALTLRSRKHSSLDAIVYKKRRRRFERQGVLVEPAALQRARDECAADASERAERRKRDAEYRAQRDAQYVREFAAAIRKRYPNMPEDREHEVARHACQKHSGRVGRCAAAKDFSPETIRLAVTAHVRHNETNYDALLRRMSRRRARAMIAAQVLRVLRSWS